MKTNSVIAICALTSVLVSAGTFFLLRHLMEGETAAAAGPGVPRLAGMTTDQARAVLQAKGLALVVSEKRPADAAGAGKILSQQPPAGAGVTRGELVQVVVGAAAAAAPAAPTGVKVPALTGLGLAAAEQALAAAGLASRGLAPARESEEAHFEALGVEAFNRERRFALPRRGLGRLLEVYLNLERAVWLTRAGYAVEVGTAWSSAVSPRNVAVRATSASSSCCWARPRDRS